MDLGKSDPICELDHSEDIYIPSLLEVTIKCLTTTVVMVLGKVSKIVNMAEIFTRESTT